MLTTPKALVREPLQAAEHHRDAFRSQYRKDGTAVEQPLSDDDSDSDICSVSVSSVKQTACILFLSLFLDCCMLCGAAISRAHKLFVHKPVVSSRSGRPFLLSVEPFPLLLTKPSFPLIVRA